MGATGPLDAEAPAYHHQLSAHLQRTEPELWAWFREASQPSRGEVEAVELGLLKSAYRLDGEAHTALVDAARRAASRLGIAREVVLHQELNADDRNARVVSLGDRVHIVFSGDLLELLSPAEQDVVLFHELAHAHLLERDDHRFGVLDRLIRRIDHEAGTSDALGETARRLRLHTEVWADRIALKATGDESSVVSTIVKVNTGLRTVDPEAYLRQAREILVQDEGVSRAWTHPELHVRIACLIARDSDSIERTVTVLIDGPDDLDHVDLLAQLRLQTLTARVLVNAIRTVLPNSQHTTELAPYFRSYPELRLPATSTSTEPFGDRELASVTPSVRHLCAALLVDVALAEDVETAPGIDRVNALTAEAKRIGVAAEFDKILARAVDQTVAELRRSRS